MTTTYEILLATGFFFAEETFSPSAGRIDGDAPLTPDFSSSLFLSFFTSASPSSFCGGTALGLGGGRGGGGTLGGLGRPAKISRGHSCWKGLHQPQLNRS